MNKQMSTIERLVAVFSAGREAASGMSHAEDGGTCNLDAAFLRLPRVHAETVAAAAEKAGTDVRESYWLGRIFFVQVATGQGARRTAMAIAATDAMEQKIAEVGRAGWSAGVFYQMD